MTTTIAPYASRAIPFAEASRRSAVAGVVAWCGRLVASALLGQAAVLQASGAPEAVALFESLGVEPWGRWVAVAVEVVAMLLLFVPRTAALGALLTLGFMSAAILAHVAVLGVSVGGDGGVLFGFALVTFAAAAAVAVTRRGDLRRR